MHSLLLERAEEGMKLEGDIGDFLLVFVENFLASFVVSGNDLPPCLSLFCVGMTGDLYVCPNNYSLG